jgi:zinc/manganese transport system substrate-binding protein
MPILRRRFLAALGGVAALLMVSGPGLSQDRIKVVASFSILAGLVRNVGGERVEVTALVGPDSDAHVYSPSPADARTVAQARVVVVNGMGFEGWLNRLVKASGTKASVVVATKGIKPRKAAGHGHGHNHGHAHKHDHGDIDPHAWQSVANVKVYVANIRDGLIAADPAGAEQYKANAAAYLAKLDVLEGEVRRTVAKIPAERRRIITNHDAFGYFEAAYGIRFIAARGVSTEAEPSARDIARIIKQIKQQKIPAVFLENVSDERLMQRIAKETGAKIGGTLYSDALTGTDGPAPTYIDLIRHNLRTLAGALTS